MKRTRKAAHAQLDDYIDWLVENGADAGRDLGTDGWTLSIDQDANNAAHAERELAARRTE